MKKLSTIGDMAIYHDTNTGWYYVKHATTDKLICKTRSHNSADIIATKYSDYHEETKQTRENQEAELIDEPYFSK